MPGLAASVDIAPGDLATLQEVPRQIETLASSVTQMLQGISSGAESGNPVGALLGGLSSLSEQAGELPSLEPLLAPVRDLSAQLPTRALGDITAIGGDIERLLGLFGPLKDAVLSGDIEGKLRDAVAQALDQTDNLLQPGDEMRRVMADLESFLHLFGSLLEWRNRTPRPEEVAALISQGLAGFPLDRLAMPVAALDAALRPLAELLPDGADLGRWQDALAGRAQFWQTLSISLDSSVDWPRVEAELQAEVRLCFDARAARDRLFSAVLAALGRVDLRAAAQVGVAAMALPPARDFRLTPIVDGLRRQLEGTVAELEAWAPTEDQARAFARGLVDQLLLALEASPIGQLRAMLVDLQQRLLLAIEELPFRALAAQAEAALRQVAQTIDVIDPDLLRRPVHEFFTGIEGKLDEFAGNAVPDALADLWGQVEQAIQQINAQIDNLRNTLQGLVAQLQTFAENLQPTLASITEAVASIKTTLDNFDLEQPASAVIDELHTLRDKVEQLDLSELPGPAVSALKAGAEFLRQLDIAGAVNPPLNDALAKVDPSTLIEAAAGKISGMTDQLKLLDPATLAEELDKPVDELLEAFSRIGPEQLRGVIQAALAPVEDGIRALDFAQLLAPVTRLYAELAAKIDAVLDPEAIFAPLDALFQPLVDVVDGLQPSRFVGLIEPHGGGFAEKLGNAAGPPGPISAAGLKDALPPGPESDDELFGFRIGDLLIPLIDLHRQLTQAFDRLDDGLLSSAGQMVHAALRGRLDALDPNAVVLRVNGDLAQVHAVLEPAQISARLADAVQAYHAAAAKIAQAARAELAAADAAAAQRSLAVLEQANPLALVPEKVQFDGVLSASLQLEAGLDLSALRAAVPGLARVEALIPEFLRAPDLGATSIRQALRDLDPAPLRDEINALFDRLGRRVVALKEVFFAALEELGRVIEEFLLPISPGNLVALADRLHAGLKEQVLAFHPSQFKDEVKLIFDTVKRQLAVFDPAIIVDELNRLRDHLIEKLRDLVAALLPDAQPFHDMQARLAQLKPSVLLEPLTHSLAPVSELIASLDPQALLQPLLEAIARVRQQLPEIIAEIEAALDEVLAAFPEGGPSSASAEVSVG